MKLNLSKPLAFIDIEGTGTKPEEDRIVEISVCILYSDLSRLRYTKRINPNIPIPASSTAIHGIKDEDVADSPTFAEIAHNLLDFIEGCDVAGFNSNKYDIPILYAEFLRVGIMWDYSSFCMIDVGNIFKIQEQRTLTAAYRFYCDKELEGAHGAEADISATVDVFLAQYEKYEDLPETMEELQRYCNYGQPILDLSGKFTTDENGEILLNFSKYKGERALDHLDFVNWMYYKASFQPDTRKVCEQLLGLTDAF